MKKYFSLFVFVVFILTNDLYAQVGINTATPKSTLDINGNLKIRTVPSLTAYPTSDQIILLVDKTSTTGDFEVKQISTDILMDTHAYYASKSGGWTLVDLGLGNFWGRVNLTGTSDTKLGSQSVFTNGTYTAPVAGVYSVFYEFQFAAGVNLEALGGKRIGLIKNGTQVWDEKLFEGVRVSLLGVTLASVPVTATNMTSLVHLNAGETITFAVNSSGLLPVDLNLLSNAKVNIHIHRVSSQTQ